jgi:hypothetical protein
MVKLGWTAFLVLATAMSTAPAFAQQSERLYTHKSWVVDGVTFDDGSLACLAEVSDPGESFTVWVFPDHSIRLQFYSEDWDFGEGDTADLEVEVDRRSPWTLTGAELLKNSVLFDLPDDDASVNFVVEVAGGNTLYLRTAAGEEVRSYSLAGSSASIDKLIDCGNAISSDGNPFR